jgi:hypothetical protein
MGCLWSLIVFAGSVALWSWLLGPAPTDLDAAVDWALMLATWLLADLGPKIAYYRWYDRQWQRGEAFHP